MTRTKPRRGPGKPRKDPSGVCRSVAVSLTPAQIATAARLGEGSPQEGIRRLIDGTARKCG